MPTAFPGWVNQLHCTPAESNSEGTGGPLTSSMTSYLSSVGSEATCLINRPSVRNNTQSDVQEQNSRGPLTSSMTNKGGGGLRPPARSGRAHRGEQQQKRDSSGPLTSSMTMTSYLSRVGSEATCLSSRPSVRKTARELRVTVPSNRIWYAISLPYAFRVSVRRCWVHLADSQGVW